MDIFGGILAFGIVAFAVWLAVRIVNRRETWAIRVAVTSVALLAYPISLGLTCRAVEQGILAADATAPVYDSLFWLEFHAPEFLQNAALRHAKALGVEAAYLRLRDAPFLRSYPVGDLTFRWKDARREFDDHDPWLLNVIATTIEPDSWEDLAGPGTLALSPENQTLDVFQSRRVHSAVASLIE